jgi:hypothetical protein
MTRSDPAHPPAAKAIITIRLDRPTHAALKVLAHEERTSVQQLVFDLIIMAIAKNDAAAQTLVQEGV